MTTDTRTDAGPIRPSECPRAFVVKDAMEEQAVVVYARNPMEARRLGHGIDDLGAMDDERDLLVERAPEFDDLNGRSLREVQLDEGWWFYCAGCSLEHVTKEDGAIVYNGDVLCVDCQGSLGEAQCILEDER